jgi:integrase
MAPIRERAKADGTRISHVQDRMTGFPAWTASFPTRRQAERWSKTIEADMIEGKHFRNAEARRRSVAEAIDRYFAEELPKKRAGDMHRHNLPWWKKNLGHLKLADVTAPILVEYRGKLLREAYTRAKPESKRSLVKGGEAQRFSRNPSTVNRYLACLSHVFTVARKEWHWMGHNPFDEVGKFSEGKGSVRFLSEEERERLLAQTAKDPQLHTFTVLALATASRAGELWNLVWNDVELKEGRLLLRKTKNAEPRSAWIHGEALRLLREHKERRLSNDRVFVSVTGKRYRYHDPFSDACKAANVVNFTFHGTRHGSATYLAREGATEQQLKAIGGWKSNVVSRYVHLAAEDAKAVVEKMSRKILGGEAA